MVEKVFLTDRRREVLRGEATDLTDQSLRNAKSRIRTRARLALKELIEVAASPEIDNSGVFEPNEVAHLIDALMVPRGSTLTPRWNYDGDSAEFRDEYQYQMNLIARLDHSIRGYNEMLHRETKPGETQRMTVPDELRE